VFFLNTSLSFKAWANYSLRSRRIKGRVGRRKRIRWKKTEEWEGGGEKGIPTRIPTPSPLYACYAG